MTKYFIKKFNTTVFAINLHSKSLVKLTKISYHTIEVLLINKDFMHKGK